MAVGSGSLIYRRDKTGKDITDVNELFDPKYKGKVTMLSEDEDTVGSVLLADGVEPEKATLDQAMNAIDRIEKAVGTDRFGASRQRLRPRPAQG